MFTCICYYHQDLHQWRLQADSCSTPSIHATLRPSFFLSFFFPSTQLTHAPPPGRWRRGRSTRAYEATPNMRNTDTGRAEVKGGGKTNPGEEDEARSPSRSLFIEKRREERATPNVRRTGT